MVFSIAWLFRFSQRTSHLDIDIDIDIVPQTCNNTLCLLFHGDRSSSIFDVEPAAAHLNH